MNLKESYFDFLTKQGAKQKVQAVITKGIEEWKKERAYEYEAGEFQENDYSGRVNMIHGKTIGDICKTDIEVLKAYTGRSEATYCSHYGFNFTRVADEISWDINKCLGCLQSEWILQHRAELMDGQDKDYIGEEWSDEELIEYIDERVLVDEYLNYEWMQQEFPEYNTQDEDIPMSDYLFNIDD